MALLNNQTQGQAAGDVQRILRIRVPVIVKLAERRMNVQDVLKLNIGSIIEFDKGSDDPLELMVNNRSIGVGVAVKVGENFGLKVTAVGDVRALVEAMGR